MIVFDEQVGKGSENSSIAGVSFVDNDEGMKSGKCGLKVKALAKQDVNTSWTCTLVAEDGTILTGTVTMESQFDSGEVDEDGDDTDNPLITGTFADTVSVSSSIFAFSAALLQVRSLSWFDQCWFWGLLVMDSHQGFSTKHVFQNP